MLELVMDTEKGEYQSESMPWNNVRGIAQPLKYVPYIAMTDSFYS